MKLHRVSVSYRRRGIELVVRGGDRWFYPFARMEPAPSMDDRIATIEIDAELAREAVSYTLESGAEGFVHIEQALDYNADPSYLAELLVHRLTVEARRRVADSKLSRRELARRLGTSLPQLYRILETDRPGKSLNQLVKLLAALGCEVDLVLREAST